MKITIADIRAKNPCYDPTKHLPEGWSGTMLDILRMEQISAVDRIWCAVRFLEHKQQVDFAVSEAREALALVEKPALRSVNALDVTECWLKGEATEKEVEDAANDAASTAYAANDAASNAASTAAYAASTAAYAASTAASTATYAASTAASTAAYTASTAAYAAYAANAAACAYEKVRERQIAKLKELFK